MAASRFAAWPLAFVMTTACVAPARVDPATPPPTASARADSAARGYTAADVRFVQLMIAHHAQALVMTDLVPARTGRADIRLIAERIEVSQKSEIALMRSWLERRGENAPVPDRHGAPHDDAGHGSMPGMLTPEEMARLARATGAAFDSLFLEYMIRHHEGALTMVATLFATPGAAQESEIFRLASDVDADQRAEIARMRAMQKAAPANAPSR